MNSLILWFKSNDLNLLHIKACFMRPPKYEINITPIIYSQHLD